MMLEGANDRSRISAYDETQDGIFTNYVDLRAIIVSEKTITQLLDLLNIPAILIDGAWKTLEKIGQCIASSIVFLESEKHFREIIQLVQNFAIDIPLIKMKVYLVIIAIVIEATPLEKEN